LGIGFFLLISRYIQNIFLIDSRVSVLNAFRSKDLAEFSNGRVYEANGEYTGWGWQMAEFQVLLKILQYFNKGRELVILKRT
jgi:hypothetical protein